MPPPFPFPRLDRAPHGPDSEALHAALQELFLAFARGVAPPSGLKTGLQSFVCEVNALVGATRTSVWLHDRRARELALAASSDPEAAATTPRIRDDDPGAPARGRRLEVPEFVDSGSGPALVAPLRGWRRALGTLTLEGTSASPLNEVQLRRIADEIARHLSVALENVQLVDEILLQRRLLEDTFNSLPDLLIVTDRALRVVQVNDALLRRLGKSRDQVFERMLGEVAGSELAAWIAEAAARPSGDAGLREPSTQLSNRSRTYDNLPLDGVFLATVTPLVSAAGDITGRVLVLRDVTIQSRLEAERESLRSRLSQSEKLAALGQFVAGVAHEMNNPLQALLGHLELLMSHTEAARPVRAELRRIYREGERAARIVRNLLVFTGTRRMARRRLRVERVLARALSSRRTALARARIDVVRHFSPAVPAVVGDPLLLQQAFLNVLINAELAIREREASGTIELATRIDGSGRVITTVRDTGPGIAPAILPRIFDPFFTTREAGKGTGLGLAVTYGIIQEHGGTIEAANSPDGGAVFTVGLPAASARS